MSDARLSFRSAVRLTGRLRLFCSPNDKNIFGINLPLHSKCATHIDSPELSGREWEDTKDVGDGLPDAEWHLRAGVKSRAARPSGREITRVPRGSIEFAETQEVMDR